MAIRLDAAADILSTPSPFVSTTAFAFSAHIYISVDSNDFSQIFGIVASGGYVFFGTNSDGTTLFVDANGTTSAGTNLTVGTWYHVFGQRLGGTFQFYLNRALNITVSANPSIGTVSSATFGADEFSQSNFNGRIAFIKLWSGFSTLFTAQQIAAESYSIRPLLTQNLFGWYPMPPGTLRTRDWSGLGHNLTAGGTLTDEPGPSVPWRQGQVVYSFPQPFAASAPVGGLSIPVALYNRRMQGMS